MTLIKFKNEQPGRYVERMPYFSELFSDLFDGMLTNEYRKTSTPSVNMMETDENFRLELAAPGLTREDFKISIDNNLLSVSADKKSETDETKERYTRKEFSYFSFKRSFNLPQVVDRENINAVYENGILIVTLPKVAEAKSKAVREIKVN